MQVIFQSCQQEIHCYCLTVYIFVDQTSFFYTLSVTSAPYYLVVLNSYTKNNNNYQEKEPQQTNCVLQLDFQLTRVAEHRLVLNFLIKIGYPIKYYMPVSEIKYKKMDKYTYYTNLQQANN